MGEREEVELSLGEVERIGDAIAYRHKCKWGRVHFSQMVLYQLRVDELNIFCSKDIFVASRIENAWLVGPAK